MSVSPAEMPGAGRRAATVRPTDRAVAALTTELTRLRGPKHGLLIGVRPDSPVLAAALDALLPDDRLILVAADGDAAQLRAALAERGAWIAERVRVAEALDDVAIVASPPADGARTATSPAADTPTAGSAPTPGGSPIAEAPATADVVIVAEPLTGTAEAARRLLDRIRTHLTEGGVLTVATLAAPGMADGASDELERQTSFYGVGSDLVIRNRPPIRIHRLRFTATPVEVAERLRPALRPSSVPLTRSMNVDSNGVAAAGILLGLAATSRAAGRRARWWLLPALAAAPIGAFFRDPERDIPDDPAAIVAACDGKVLSVERIVDKRLGDDEFLRVAVFLSVLDVHVNRSPVAGRVADYFVEDGGYAAAMSPAAEHNVAAYTVLDTVHGTVVVAQRTGLLARRIVQRAPIGSMLAKGERFGLIRFGSRTDVYLPASAADPTVAPRDTVRGGTTTIARWRS